MAAMVGALAISLVGGTAPAVASEGSIPQEVATYASDPTALLATLASFAGVDASGKGLDFGDAATVGSLSRVFGFTSSWLAGAASDPPVELRNEWAAPITIGGKAVGVAVIWINDATVAPELADFIQDAGMAAALGTVPADAWLVHDDARAAWFILAGANLAVVAKGSADVATSTSLADYQTSRADKQQPPVSDQDSLAVPIVLVGIVSLAIVAAVIVPWRRRKRAS